MCLLDQRVASMSRGIFVCCTVYQIDPHIDAVRLIHQLAQKSTNLFLIL